jgi:sulfur carrier protein
LKLKVNGDLMEIEGQTSISDLLLKLDVKSPRVAVECNLEIVPKVDYGTTILKENDNLEIVAFVGGG